MPRMMATSVDVDFCWRFKLSLPTLNWIFQFYSICTRIGNPSLHSLNLVFTTGLDLPILSICTRIERFLLWTFATGLDLPILQYPYENWAIPLFELWTSTLELCHRVSQFFCTVLLLCLGKFRSLLLRSSRSLHSKSRLHMCYLNI